MSIWEDFSSSYIEAAASSLPLHRAVIALAGALGSLGIAHQTHKSICESVLRMEVINLVAPDSPLLKGATLANVVVGVCAAVAGLVLSRLLLWVVFSLAERSTGLQSRAVKQSLANIGQRVTLDQRKSEIELLSASLEQPRKRLRGYNSAAEVATGFSAMFFVFSYWGNALDFAVAGIFALIAVVITIVSTQFFLSDYFGPAMVKAELEGRRAPSLSDLS